MDIKKLQKEIENLPENEKQTIQKIGKLNDTEMEEIVGGLSDKAKNILMAIGAAAVATTAVAGTSATFGYRAGHRSGRKEAIAQYTAALQKRDK